MLEIMCENRIKIKVTQRPKKPATKFEEAIMLPALTGSVSLNSATYFVEVVPRLNPAKTAKKFNVDCIIPYSP